MSAPEPPAPMEVQAARTITDAAARARWGAWLCMTMGARGLKPTHVAERMTALGAPVTRAGVEKWMGGTIPGANFVLTLALVLDVLPVVVLRATEGKL